MSQKGLQLYTYNDDICFSVDQNKEVNFICRKHFVPFLAWSNNAYTELSCAMCEIKDHIDSIELDMSYEMLKRKALAMYESLDFKKAKLVKLDDYYLPELKIKNLMGKKSPYFVKGNVETDKDGDTTVVLYVGVKGVENKVQFFIKPEKLQLSHDFTDMDPANVLAKIELTFKDRTIIQKFDKKNS